MGGRLQCNGMAFLRASYVAPQRFLMPILKLAKPDLLSRVYFIADVWLALHAKLGGKLLQSDGQKLERAISEAFKVKQLSP